MRILIPTLSNLKVGCQTSDPAGLTEAASEPNAERDAALEQLKLYGRDPSFADPIFTKEVRQL